MIIYDAKQWAVVTWCKGQGEILSLHTTRNAAESARLKITTGTLSVLKVIVNIDDVRWMV